MDADFGQQSQAFTLLHDKNMLAPASAASWCPTMDLLALATSDGQLALSRLDWNKTGGERENRLWTANPDSPVTSLGWRPDGKILVSGHADGAVQLYHAEDGEVLHASTPHRGSAVTSLHWQDAPAEDSRRSACAYQSATSRFALPTNGGGGVHDRPRRDGAKADAGAGAGAGALDASAGRGREGPVRPLRPPDAPHRPLQRRRARRRRHERLRHLPHRVRPRRRLPRGLPHSWRRHGWRRRPRGAPRVSRAGPLTNPRRVPRQRRCRRGGGVRGDAAVGASIG